jgi:hypothetical protein
MVTVISDCDASAFRLGSGFAGAGRKTPAAVVIRDGSGLTATDLRGRPLDPGRLDAECPGLVDAMEGVGR